MTPTEVRKFYDNKEEHGTIIDWKKVFSRYNKILKGAKVTEPLYNPTTCPILEAKWFVELSERASGKTTNWLIVSMICYCMYGTQCQYVRSSENEIKPSIANELFNVILSYNNGYYVRAITGGKYSSIYIHWKKAYFCNMNPDTGKPEDIDPEPFLQFLSVDNHMDYKSSYNAPTGDIIIYDEFINPSICRPNIFCDFCDLCSTIIRKRKSAVILMLANTIDYNSMWFKELEVSREVKKLKVGQSKIITTEKGTHVYVELIGNKPSAIKSEINRLFYGFNNPRLAAITGGEQTWSFTPVPHISNSDTDKIIDRSIHIDCGDVMLQLDLVETEDRGLIVNVHESTTLYHDSIVLTNGEIRAMNQMWGLGEGNYCKLVWGLYAKNKWYFDCNETGSLIDNYVKIFRQLRR